MPLPDVRRGLRPIARHVWISRHETRWSGNVVALRSVGSARPDLHEAPGAGHRTSRHAPDGGPLPPLAQRSPYATRRAPPPRWRLAACRRRLRRSHRERRRRSPPRHAPAGSESRTRVRPLISVDRAPAQRRRSWPQQMAGGNSSESSLRFRRTVTTKQEDS